MANSDGLLGSLGADAQALCKRTWWVFLIGGLAAIVFGVLAFKRPVEAFLIVSLFFAASVLVDGVFNVIGAVQHRDKDGWWIMLLIGALGVLVGGYALLNPPISMMAFLYLVALQAIMLGVFLIMLGYKVRAITQREWILYLAGGSSVLFGILAIANPLAGSLSVITLIAAWALVTGVLKVIFAFRVKSLPARVGDRITGLR
jgi:uncharacterized membrane protein HdeD (DUF308 family)